MRGRCAQCVLVVALAAMTGAAAVAVHFAPPPAGELPPAESYWRHKFFYERNVGRSACHNGATVGRITDVHYGEWREAGESNGATRWIYSFVSAETSGSGSRLNARQPERRGVRIRSFPAALVTVAEGACAGARR